MFQSNPYAANNGLRVIGRTSQSISLTWASETEKLNSSGRESVESILKPESVSGATDEDTENSDVTSSIEAEKRNNNWFHVQMRRAERSTACEWESIYKGYSYHFQIQGLPPDSAFIFRMKRNDEYEWGSEICGSTETLPASVEDFNRAVEMRSEDLVTRIFELTRPSHLKRILQTRDRNGMTALMVASQMGNAGVVEKLISFGVDINAASSGCSRTSLMFACVGGHISVVKILDHRKANWNTRDKCGCTALDYSINCDNLPLVKLAYSKLGKACLTKSDHSGWTPFMRATIVSDNLDILKFLLKKGADINCTTTIDSKTPLLAAVLAKKKKFVQFLLDHGADPLHENLYGTNCFQAARGLQYREISEMIAKKVHETERRGRDSAE